MAVTEDITGGLHKIKWAWTCTSAGATSEASTKQYNGVIQQLITIPGTSDDAPTAAYDVTVFDGDSVDVLAGLGADRSATATEYKKAIDGLGFVKSSALTLNIANAGDVATGTVILYIIDLDKGVVG
jgi:hypothetical protein